MSVEKSTENRRAGSRLSFVNGSVVCSWRSAGFLTSAEACPWPVCTPGNLLQGPMYVTCSVGQATLTQCRKAATSSTVAFQTTPHHGGKWKWRPLENLSSECSASVSQSFSLVCIFRLGYLGASSSQPLQTCQPHVLVDVIQDLSGCVYPALGRPVSMKRVH